MDSIDPPTERSFLLPHHDTSSIIEEDETLEFRTEPNPLPKAQLLNVLLVGLCSSLSQLAILPFINQFVGEMDIIGGDKRKVGFYTGLLESLYNVSHALTILHWSRLSDQIGRKPILVISVGVVVICMPFLGLARTYSGLVASRCLLGLLDGTNSVTSSVMGEITDSSNRAGAAIFGLVSGSIAGSVGALIGGNLANPSRHFPEIFGGDFWVQYPYFLPCLVVAMISVASLLFFLISFEETVVKPLPLQRLEEESILSSSDEDETLSVRQLLAHRPVVIAIMNHMALNFLFTCEGAVVPLFFAMPSEIGGVGFDPVHIGYILSGYRAFMVFFLLTGSSRIIRRYGERSAFIISLFGCMSIWIVMPAINFWARRSGKSAPVWAGIAFMALPLGLLEMGTVCSFVYYIAATPTRRSLGSMSGLVWTMASIIQAVAPAVATSLFSLSATYDILGGYAIYAVLFTLSCFAVLLARKLPHDTRPAWEVETEW